MKKTEIIKILKEVTLNKNVKVEKGISYFFILENEYILTKYELELLLKKLPLLLKKLPFKFSIVYDMRGLSILIDEENIEED